MVSLLRHIRQEFNHLTRQRGDEIWRAGGVRNLQGDEIEASAQVKGNQTYRVEAERDEEDLLTSCECPYFADHFSCKHVWAFLQAAEAIRLPFDPLRQAIEQVFLGVRHQRGRQA